MLTIEPPIYQLRGNTIFRDHENPDQFYVLPGPAALAAGQAGHVPFTLYKYRRDLTDNPAADPSHGRGAGMALFETEAGIPNAGRLQAELAGIAGRPNARLGPVAFRNASAHAIVAHGSGDNFVEDLVQTIKVAPVAPHHAAFALALTAEGATLMERAARGGALPIGVAYEMTFLALTPSLHVTVTMQYDRIYDHFSAAAAFTYYVSAKLDLELAWLIEHDLIEIEMTSFDDDAETQHQRQLVMNLIAARVQQDFFRSGIPPEPEPNGTGGALAQMLGGLVGGSNVTSASAFFVLKARLDVVRERKTLELKFDGRTAVELTHVATGLLTGMLSDSGSAPDIQAIDLDDPFFSALNVQVLSSADFANLPELSEMVVHLAYDTHRDSFAFSRDAAGPRRFQAALTSPSKDEYEYVVEYHFDQQLSVGDSIITAPARRTRQRVLVADPLADMTIRRIRLTLAAADLPGVAQIVVSLRLRDDDAQVDLAQTRITLDRNHMEQVWRMHLPPGKASARVLASVGWQDAQGTLHPGPEAEVVGDNLVTFGPFAGLLAIRVQPAVDWTRVTKVSVELRYQDANDVAERSLVFGPSAAADSQQVAFPIRDTTRRTYRWRQTIIRADGSALEGDWADADRGLLLVGQEISSNRDVRVVWVGAAGDALGLRIDFRVTQPQGEDFGTSIFLRAGTDGDKMATLPLDADGQLAYRFEVKRVTEQGETTMRTGEGRSNLLVVQASG